MIMMILNEDDQKIIRFLEKNKGRVVTTSDIMKATNNAWRTVIMKLAIFRKLGIVEGGKAHSGQYWINDNFDLKSVKAFIPSREQAGEVLTPDAEKMLSVMGELASQRDYITLQDIREGMGDIKYWKFQHSVYILKMLGLIARKQRGLYFLTDVGKDYLASKN